MQIVAAVSEIFNKTDRVSQISDKDNALFDSRQCQ